MTFEGRKTSEGVRYNDYVVGLTAASGDVRDNLCQRMNECNSR